jgi:hypothetical protein
MTWLTMVGVDGGQRRATTWVMMWEITWATRKMAATTPAMMPANWMAGTPAKGVESRQSSQARNQLKRCESLILI